MFVVVVSLLLWVGQLVCLFVFCVGVGWSVTLLLLSQYYDIGEREGATLVQMKFSLSLYLHLYQGSTLSLTNVVTYPHCFLTAYKMTSRPSILAETSD